MNPVDQYRQSWAERRGFDTNAREPKQLLKRVFVDAFEDFLTDPFTVSDLNDSLVSPSSPQV